MLKAKRESANKAGVEMYDSEYWYIVESIPRHNGDADAMYSGGGSSRTNRRSSSGKSSR